MIKINQKSVSSLITSLLMRFLVIRFLVVLMLASGSALGQDANKHQESGRDASSHWDYLISGWKAEREKLRSYQLSVKGFEQHYKSRTKTMTPELILPTYRDEIQIQIFSTLSGTRTKNKIHWGDQVQSKGTWVRDDALVAEWNDTPDPVVNIISSTDRRQNFAIELDPRTVGLFGTAEFKKFKSSKLFEECCQLFSSTKALETINDLGVGRFEVVLSKDLPDKKNRFYTYIIINERQGFSIEKYSTKIMGLVTQVLGPNDSEMNVKWKLLENIWLPSSMSDTRFSGHYKAELTFDWRSVNGPIDDREFSIVSMGAPKDTLISDARLGRDHSFISGRVGAPLAVVDKVDPVPVTSLRWTTLFFVMASALVTCFIAWFLIKRLSLKPPRSPR